MQWWCSAQGEPWTWAWQAYPGVWLFIGAIALAYARLMRRYRGVLGRARQRVHSACFAAGLLILWLALDWPIGALGAGYLASVHMIQFLALGMLVPPLLLYGIPEAAFEDLPAILRSVLRPVTHPAVSFATFNLLVVATHTPALVDGLMSSQLGSFFIDVAWLGGGLLFWWPVVVSVPGSTQLRDLARVGYLGLQLIAMKPVFIYLTFSTYPKYATYELAPRINGISARADQQIAGLLMEVAGMIIILIAVGAVFLKWTARERAQTRPAPETVRAPGRPS